MGENRAGETTESAANVGRDTGRPVDNGQVTIDDHSATGSFRFGEVGHTTHQTANFLDSVPQEYRDKEFVKNIARSDNPNLEVFKKIENLQSLVGKRGPEVPGADATPEQIATFNKAWGVPETPDAYDLSVEWGDADKEIGQKISENRDPEFMKHMKGVFLKANMNKVQAKQVVAEFERYTLDRAKKQAASAPEEMEKQNKEFDRITLQKFGTDAQNVLNVGRGMIGALADKDEKEAFMTFDNKQAVALASFLKRINDKYIREDGFTAASQTTTSKEDLEKERYELMASEAFNKPMHKDHDKVKARVAQLYGTAPKGR